MAEDKIKPREPIVARRDGDVRAPRRDNRKNTSESGFPDGSQRDYPDSSRRGSQDNYKESFARVDKPKTGGSLLIVLVILLAVGLAGLGWFAWQQSQAQAVLQQRFDELAGKIESTDESLNQSGAALSVKLLDHSKQLETQWSEIKKLWGVTNDRNKKAIEALQLAVAESDKAAQKLTKNLGSLADADKKLSGKISELGSSSLAATARVDAVAERVDQLDGAQQRLRQVEERQRSLESRLKTNETAIESIDAFRRQTNQTLNTLRQAQPAQ